VVFLGAYVAAYSAIVMAGHGVEIMTDQLIGGRSISFWYAFGPALDIVPDTIFETLRMCLLAVAFRRCLELFWAGSHDIQHETFPDPLGLDRPLAADARFAESRS
jgi:hypothetical protein